MKLKTLIVTIAVLAVLSIGVFIAQRPAPPAAADTRVNEPLVSAATLEQVAKLRLTDQGRTVSVDRQPEGAWIVTSYHDLPADFSKLQSFVGNLAEAKIQRLVTSNPERIARLEFKDTKIELLDAAGKALVSLTLGRHADTGGGRFVRFGSEDKAYLANLSAWLDTESRNWADSALVTLAPDDVNRIEIPLVEGGTVVATREKKEDAWSASPTPDGQQLRGDRVSSLLSSLSGLRFTDTAALDDANVTAAKANLRTFKLGTFGGQTLTVALGRKPEEKKLKPPTASGDGKTGPASLGSVSDLEKKDDAKPAAPEYETIPAGPVYAFITHSDASAPVNTWMQKRAFQIAEYVFTGLPQKTEDLFEAAPAPAESTSSEPASPEPRKE